MRLKRQELKSKVLNGSCQVIVKCKFNFEKGNS